MRSRLLLRRTKPSRHVRYETQCARFSSGRILEHRNLTTRIADLRTLATYVEGHAQGGAGSQCASQESTARFSLDRNSYRAARASRRSRGIWPDRSVLSLSWRGRFQTKFSVQPIRSHAADPPVRRAACDAPVAVSQCGHNTLSRWRFPRTSF